jgi:hypothetical protein
VDEDEDSDDPEMGGLGRPKRRATRLLQSLKPKKKNSPRAPPRKLIRLGTAQDLEASMSRHEARI